MLLASGNAGRLHEGGIRVETIAMQSGVDGPPLVTPLALNFARPKRRAARNKDGTRQTTD